MITLFLGKENEMLVWQRAAALGVSQAMGHIVGPWKMAGLFEQYVNKLGFAVAILALNMAFFF